MPRSKNKSIKWYIIEKGIMVADVDSVKDAIKDYYTKYSKIIKQYIRKEN